MRYGRATLDGTARWVRLGSAGMTTLSGPPWEHPSDTGEVPFRASDLLAPVVPTKVLCVGRNYAAHAKEMGSDVPKEPLLFLKPPSSITGPFSTVLLPRQSQRVEHEAELGIVVGKRAKDVPPERALEHVFGYTCANDITARDLQRSDGQWSRAKGFDGFCPVGPWIETEIEPGDLAIACRVNGETRQRGRTSSMIFGIRDLVSAMSSAMTLEPGDLLLTGTPEGVSPIRSGDRVEVEIEGIGTLEVFVS
jgi:2-keto-4-pentenoate hydratase/2-oxohepta-3-ene-1,7-dioic acid hydratase in catechol pathway